MIEEFHMSTAYEAPKNPEVAINTVELSVEETADAVLSFKEGFKPGWGSYPTNENHRLTWHDYSSPIKT